MSLLNHTSHLRCLLYETIFFRTSKAGINKMKYLYKVTHYFETPIGESLFDDIQSRRPAFVIKKLEPQI